VVPVPPSKRGGACEYGQQARFHHLAVFLLLHFSLVFGSGRADFTGLRQQEVVLLHPL
jgi:hypothetical protein